VRKVACVIAEEGTGRADIFAFSSRAILRGQSRVFHRREAMRGENFSKIASLRAANLR